MRTRTLVFGTAVLLGPALAWAQGTPPAQGAGPLRLEPLEDQVVVAPDYKIADVDGRTESFAGAYAGWQSEWGLFLGGAGYYLINGDRGTEMTYGGALVGWSTSPTRSLQFGARALVGGGTVRLRTEIGLPFFSRAGSDIRFGSGARPGSPVTVEVLAEDQFFVVEPQATVLARLGKRVGIRFGVGYRVTAASDFLEHDRLDGVTGSVALQIGLK